MGECISIEGLKMHYPGCDALQGVNLSVAERSVFALLGENGAGKTTLIRILTGFLKPTGGLCRVLGLDPQQDALELRRRVGYVSDAPSLYDWMRVDEIGWFTAAFYPEGFIDRYRESIDRYEVPLTRKIRHLSKGQRAKVALALATAHDPALLILDEPTSGLDPLVRREFMESMVERAATGRTVLLSSHQISEVERVADQVVILHQGKVRLNTSLSEVRELFSEITFSLVDPLAVMPYLGNEVEILDQRQDGRQVRWIARGCDDPSMDALALWPGVSNIRQRPATLEELFAACTRGCPPQAIEEDIFSNSSSAVDRQAS